MSRHFVVGSNGGAQVIKLRAKKGKQMSFGDRLKQARYVAGMNQPELAEACGWVTDNGPAQSRIANYEANSREPTLGDIILMAQALGLPPEELAFGSIGLSQDEAELIQAWRLSSTDSKEAFRAIVKVSKRPRRAKRPNLKEVSPGAKKDHDTK